MDNNNNRNNQSSPLHLRRKKRGIFDRPQKKSTPIEKKHTPHNDRPTGATAPSAPETRTASRRIPDAAKAVQRDTVPVSPDKVRKSGVGTIVLRVVAMFMTFVLMIVLTLVISLKMICSDISPAAKNTFVTTLLETGQLKFLASMFVPEDEIQKIVDGNTMEEMKDEVDSSLISININNAGQNNSGNSGGTNADRPDIEVIEISGRTYYGTLLIIKDPSRVSLASIYKQNGNSWPAQGVTLDKLVTDSGAVAGMNSGLYDSSNNSGGRPFGIVVADGEIQLNAPQSYEGLVLIGFDENHILQIIDVDGMTAAETKAMIEEKGIRDAVTFQEEATDKNNHFVKLVINGKAREMNGAGSGLNPRTCIGQCADGSILMLVTDGRGKDGHLGASASDLIGIMMEYGAVNAANLDGGSSSCMYYEDEYLMTSVTFYYSNESWRMPTAFVVK